MKTKTILLAIALILLFSGQLKSQELTQKIKGSIVDRETQNPLPGATIIIEGTNPLLGTTTDKYGNFILENVLVGRHNLSVRYLGYESYRIPEILVSTGKEVQLKIQMNELPEQLGEVTVKPTSGKDQSINSMAYLSARTFSVEEASRYAGGFDDPARMASSFAGITTGSLEDNSIVIRGNAPKGILWQLEGVPIPNPNHFAGAVSAGGGFVSIFSSQMMSNSDFFTGAFPAEYGNATAGVFDMKFRTGNNEKSEYWFQSGMLGLDAGSEGPFVKGKKSSYLFNYRYSTYGLLEPLMPEGSGLPVYQDLSFKLNFPTKNVGIFSLWGIGATDKILKYENTNPDEWESVQDAEREQTKMKPGAIGFSHKYITGNNSYINTTIAATNYSGNHIVKRLDDFSDLKDIQFIDISEQKIIIHSFLNKKFSTNHINRTGVTYSKLFYNIDLQESKTPGIPMQQFVNSKGISDLLQGYTQSKINLSPSVSVNVGAHVQYFFLNGNYSIEPRAGLKWKFRPEHSLSFGFGKHSQLEDLKIYLAERDGKLPNKDLNFSNSLHLIAAYDWKISDVLRFKVEPYFQYLYNIPVIQDSSYSMINFHQQWFMNDKLENKGTGTNLGIDFTFERFLKDGFYWLATASIFNSKYVGGDGIERNSAYDKRIVSNLLFGKEFYFNTNPNKQRILGLNGKLTYMGGERLNPILVNESLEAKDVIFDHTRAFERKADPNLIANITVSYRKNKPSYSSVWSLQIINLFNAPSSNHDFYNYKTGNLDVSTTNVMVPNISYKIEF